MAQLRPRTNHLLLRKERPHGVSALGAELEAAGAWVFAGGLHPASTATVVRSVDGKIVSTDGPFADTKERLGGFWVIKADDLDAALAWAAKASAACRGPVEVRPFEDEDATPEEFFEHASTP